MVRLVETEQGDVGGFQNGDDLIGFLFFESGGRGDRIGIGFCFLLRIFVQWKLFLFLLLRTPAKSGQKCLIGGHRQESRFPDVGGNDAIVFLLKE